jgi:hypothetical protein
MNLICTNCGEPWDLYHVLHEAEPQDIKRQGGLIRHCPCCDKRDKAPPTPSQQYRLHAIAEAACLFGDDVDGLACFLDDLADLED